MSSLGWAFGKVDVNGGSMVTMRSCRQVRRSGPPGLYGAKRRANPIRARRVQRENKSSLQFFQEGDFMSVAQCILM
jgi:hypothetical protein